MHLHMHVVVTLPARITIVLSVNRLMLLNLGSSEVVECRMDEALRTASVCRVIRC